MPRSLTAVSLSQESFGGTQSAFIGRPRALCLSRESKTFTERELRLNSQRIVTATLRSQESSDDRKARLSADRERSFNRVCCSVDNVSGEILFLDAPGETGNTFLTKVILARIRNQNKIALAVASSGIAATIIAWRKNGTQHLKFLST
ncbi:hypothetical protein PYW07_012785 [Mythimna separata]|uniref:ATP-dependent DNA helicase n=1 Tax=Mythimna separata TaxID=271217 RepID=A0AAD7Y8V7_MYTSE|nr:hypothetical protein PYW07_012785 [Mythimna separata]